MHRIVTSVALVGLVGVVAAQGPSDSHVKLPPAGQDLQKAFEERFGRAAQASALADLTKLIKTINRDDLRRALKNQKHNDPNLAKKINTWKSLLQKLSKQDKDKIEDAFKKRLNIDPDKLRPGGSGGVPKTKTPPPVTPPPVSPGPVDPPPVEPIDPKTQAEAQEWLTSAARWLNRNAGQLKGNPDLEKLVRELARLAAEGKEAGLDVEIARWYGTFKGTGQWLKPAWSELRKMKMPNVNLPGGGPRLPRVAAPAAPDSGSWQWLVWLVVVGLVGWGVWKWRWTRAAADSRAPAWKPGPWPIPPHQVSNREDIVRTFEHLSLQKFGLSAHAWNHQEIADRLDDEAAMRLAGAYEHARYAPGSEAMPAEALAAARRDLCYLADWEEEG